MQKCSTRGDAKPWTAMLPLYHPERNSASLEPPHSQKCKLQDPAHGPRHGPGETLPGLGHSVYGAHHSIQVQGQDKRGGIRAAFSRGIESIRPGPARFRRWGPAWEWAPRRSRVAPVLLLRRALIASAPLYRLLS